MTLVGFACWAVCGLLVGLAASYFLPESTNEGLLKSMVLGLFGAIPAGVAYFFIAGSPNATLLATWPGWIVAAVGSVFMIAGYVKFYPKV